MVKAVPFQTRARTIDHLGREQIADCPTAISELWKNAFDAYAREVTLHIFDGEAPVAVVADNGHGMNENEFVSRWLVVGTESKVSGGVATVEDLNGLRPRPKQGQKGIGRLSCAALGSLLLVVSKRWNHPFVAAMVNWKLFENPFLLLQDIYIPVVIFEKREDIFKHLPEMHDSLMSNVWGEGRNTARDQRIQEAWNSFDAVEMAEGKDLSRENIESALVNTAFTEKHLGCWPLWKGNADRGTALLIGDISQDLKAQLPPTSDDSLEKQARDKLFQTLSSFTDPYSGKLDHFDASQKTDDPHEFTCSVHVRNNEKDRVLISENHEFDLVNLSGLEHVVYGRVNEAGVFRGKIKAFGKWLEGTVEIKPAGRVPKRVDTKVGPFHIIMATYERMLNSSSHPPEIHSKYREWASRYSGLLVYRDNLRVMPYGREDFDFFEIEKRRSLHAGREFWNLRNMFGRIAITRAGNPNLKDKSGREGLIDNSAAKGFKDIVENILRSTARRFFGTDSLVRHEEIPEIKERNVAFRAEEARKRLRKKRRKQFRVNLKKKSPRLVSVLKELDDFAAAIKTSPNIPDEEILMSWLESISNIKENFSEFTLGEAPSKLGTLEEPFQEFRMNKKRAKALLKEIEGGIHLSLEQIHPKDPKQSAVAVLQRNAAQLHSRLRKWSNQATSLLKDELKRIDSLTKERNKAYHAKMFYLLDDVENGRISLVSAISMLDLEKDAQDQDNAELYEPYISALESLQESIDLEGLAAFGMEQVAELRQEIDRLNSLAQLGITVEIIGHELEGLSLTIDRGIQDLPESAKNTRAFDDVKTSYQDLADRLRFLSPLKLSGEKSREWISGADIYRYLERFFGDLLAKNRVSLEATPAFSEFRIHEQKARLFPVFINLVNNARYWVCQISGNERKILLDAEDAKVFIADDGPGVSEEDQKYLFTIFFTRKVRGGRGIGLYLCRANLAVSGHKISYVKDQKTKRLEGANFMIEFMGV